MNNTDEQLETNLPTVKCGLCGYSFTTSDCVKVCKNCPSFVNCSLIKCPNCGYEFPPMETSTGQILRSIKRRITRKGGKL
ncbi:MAG: hypothetical protein ACFFCZ_06085 [Promethearchaeota archaeon]